MRGTGIRGKNVGPEKGVKSKVKSDLQRATVEYSAGIEKKKSLRNKRKLELFTHSSSADKEN